MVVKIYYNFICDFSVVVIEVLFVTEGKQTIDKHPTRS